MRTRSKILMMALTLLLAATTPVFAQSPEQRGQRLLASHCAMCHAVGRQGGSSHRQAPPFRTLSKRYPIDSLSEALGEGLITGHPDMPEFVFSPRDIGAILAYLRAIQER